MSLIKAWSSCWEYSTMWAYRVFCIVSEYVQMCNSGSHVWSSGDLFLSHNVPTYVVILFSYHSFSSYINFSNEHQTEKAAAAVFVPSLERGYYCQSDLHNYCMYFPCLITLIFLCKCNIYICFVPKRQDSLFSEGLPPGPGPGLYLAH